MKYVKEFGINSSHPPPAWGAAELFSASARPASIYGLVLIKRPLPDVLGNQQA